MLMDAETFCHRTSFELDQLVEDLQETTHRSSPAERTAWRNSLPAFAQVVSHPDLSKFHVCVGQRGGMSVEYRLPSSPSWADIVLLGRGPLAPSAVIVELKDWDVRGDKPGDRPGLVERTHGTTGHPSDQVQGYTEYCQRFHSAISESGAQVHGCVFFTFASEANAYIDEPYRDLVAQYPVFVRSQHDLQQRFPKYLAERLVAPDIDFAACFERGRYQQDRGFVKQISEAIRGGGKSPFVLLDQQRVGFDMCVRTVDRQLKPARASAKRTDRKSVVLIEGPPGSGKSVIAAHLWASLAADERIDGNVVLTTTSVAQRTNWEVLFERACGKRSARGVVIGANQYNPGLNQAWLKAQRAAGNQSAIVDWKKNLERFNAAGGSRKCSDDAYAVSIVDEAHALIDPTTKGREGMSPSGWQLHAGPQAWHVIRASRVAIFLMDPEQSYRDNETTSVARIQEFAADFGADVTQISLAGSQFRCGGSVEYMHWLDRTLCLRPSDRGTTSSPRLANWRSKAGGPYEFEVFDTPIAMEDALRPHLAAGRSARIVASYARKWKTKGVASPNRLADHNKDFQIEYKHGSETRVWSRIWNHAPSEDYSLFVQAPPESLLAADNLSQVGCPYVVRGFDFDYVGLLWFSDLVWRRNGWQSNLNHVHETAWRLSLSRAKRLQAGADQEVVRRLQRGYRILMSRAIRGTYVWFEDAETREHMLGLLNLGGR
jgi:DUF2075 family protein